jgi:hypothetical protein
MLGCLLTFQEAHALAPDIAANPFQNIVLANVFRLREPPLPIKPVAAKLPLPPLKLTGILGFGKTRALLEGWLPAKQFFSLAQGERDGDIEVLRIDQKTGSVEVRIFGTVTNLSFERNGVGMPNPAAAGAVTTPLPAVTPSQPGPQLSRDEYAFVIEAERERLKQAGDPTANLMPPTHLTPAGAPGTEVLADGAQPTELNPITPARKRAR